ncbi:YafY family transcriptional regulator [Agromyces endophyticus]|uniref:helix-turn-helix transcriptional regulator n=1 Tax=Agromyces sp. H17E-10 TaxID=2932244 RepID=UPI001FD45FCA|nr:YafY family protein [Agromyces sp. H17E-10]UOQ90173.1 YafY family transcriptional regulator [Agromyces sp. H17E-10]
MSFRESRTPVNQTATRVLQVLALLRQRQDWTATELAERLAVSTRTIRSDIGRLRQLGYVIDATSGRAGGYRLDRATDLPPLMLDDDEGIAVAIALHQVTSNAVAGIEASAARSLAKLEHVLPHQLAEQVSAMAAATAPQARDTGPSVEAPMLAAIAGAVQRTEWLRFEYTPFQGEASLRRVEPYRLVSWGRRWYLVAFDLERDDWRSFRVDRMALRPPTRRRFNPRGLPADDVAGYVLRGVASAGWRFRARVVVHAPASVVAEKIDPSVGLVETIDDERCVLVTGADHPMTVAVYLALLDEDFTVDGPPELTEAIQVLARRYATASA